MAVERQKSNCAVFDDDSGAVLIDTHCHLDAAEFDADRDVLVSNALAVGVEALVAPAVTPDNFIAVRACAER